MRSYEKLGKKIEVKKRRKMVGLRRFKKKIQFFWHSPLDSANNECYIITVL